MNAKRPKDVLMHRSAAQRLFSLLRVKFLHYMEVKMHCRFCICSPHSRESFNNSLMALAAQVRHQRFLKENPWNLILLMRLFLKTLQSLALFCLLSIKIFFKPLQVRSGTLCNWWWKAWSALCWMLILGWLEIMSTVSDIYTARFETLPIVFLSNSLKWGSALRRRSVAQSQQRNLSK